MNETVVLGVRVPVGVRVGVIVIDNVEVMDGEEDGLLLEECV